jgi:hypothetical protein
VKRQVAPVLTRFGRRFQAMTNLAGTNPSPRQEQPTRYERGHLTCKAIQREACLLVRTIMASFVDPFHNQSADVVIASLLERVQGTGRKGRLQPHYHVEQSTEIFETYVNRKRTWYLIVRNVTYSSSHSSPTPSVFPRHRRSSIAHDDERTLVPFFLVSN